MFTLLNVIAFNIIIINATAFKIDIVTRAIDIVRV